MTLSYSRIIQDFMILLLSILFLIQPVVALSNATQAKQNLQVKATQLFQAGKDLSDQEKYADALERWKKALEIYQEIGDLNSQGETLQSIGKIYISISQYSEALEFLEKAVISFKRTNNLRGEGRTLSYIGGIYLLKGDTTSGVKILQQSLSISQRIKDQSSEALSLQSLGSSYLISQDYILSFEHFQKSLEICKQIDELGCEGINLYYIGNIYVSLGQYTESLKFYERSLKIIRKIDDHKGEGSILNAIAFVYNKLENYPEALEFSKEALKISQKVGDRNGEGLSLISIGLVYSEIEDYSKALEAAQRSLIIFKKIGDLRGESLTLNILGYTSNKLGNHTTALEYAQQSLVISRNINARENEGDALNIIGLALLKSHKEKEAEIAFYKAIEIFESLRPGLTDENKVSLFETRKNTYQLQQEVLTNQNKIESALEVSERGRARAFVEILSLKIDRFKNSSLKSIPYQRPNINQIKEISKEQNSLLIEYSIINKNYLYIWVVQVDGSIVYRKVTIPKQISLIELVDASREVIGVRARGSFQFKQGQLPSNPTDRLKELHKLLIEPIADLLPTDPNAHVIFVPHGELFLVPFPALQDAKGTYLLEKHTILTAPAIQVLDLTRKKRQQIDQAGLTEALVVGNPTMPQLTKLGGQPEKLTQLPNAEREANQVSDLLKTRAWTGTQATKAAIVPKLSQARIIHLATHGFLDDLKGLGTPGAIALAPAGNGEPNDGLLTANEILDLKLNAELVVLSACDTGRGKITSDSVIGLSRSLIIAGASSVMVSLWSVPDAPTADLMTEFYKNWKERKLDKAQALRQAMLTIMKRPNAQPKDWAAFTLIGESN